MCVKRFAKGCRMMIECDVFVKMFKMSQKWESKDPSQSCRTLGFDNCPKPKHDN